MGRAKVIRKPHLHRPLRDRINPEDYYWTQEEVKRSIQRWSFLWEPISDSDSESSSLGAGKPLLKELSAYGEWRVPEGMAYDFQTTGRQILKNLSNFPYPEMILPPVSLSSLMPNTLRVNRPPYLTHRIFEHVLPDLYERAKELSKPEEPEGAVGYDRRHYDSPTLIRCLCSRPEPRGVVAPLNWKGVREGESWMDGRCCARLLVELNAPLVDYARLRRGRKHPKILKGLGKIRKIEGERRISTRWMRPRARILLHSESALQLELELEEVEQQEQWEMEEQLPSEDYYVEYANDEVNSGDVEVETEQSWHSSEELLPQITRSQSDLTLEYLKSSPMLRRSLSLSNIY